MRLSDVLGKAVDGCYHQVEPFLGNIRATKGTHRKIQVGKIARNYFCLGCKDNRTFMSTEQLCCLVAGDHIVSVDASLKCSSCGISFEAWFLIVIDERSSFSAPRVRLERITEQRREIATGVNAGNRDFVDLLDSAQVAFEQNLGAGAMVYLRTALEMVTFRVAQDAGISRFGAKGGKKPFRNLLEEVDRIYKIVPKEFSANGHQLFEELSEVIHGNSSEIDALRKYFPCRRLVVGVIENVKSSRELKQAAEELGWNQDQSFIATPSEVTA